MKLLYFYRAAFGRPAARFDKASMEQEIYLETANSSRLPAKLFTQRAAAAAAAGRKRRPSLSFAIKF